MTKINRKQKPPYTNESKISFKLRITGVYLLDYVESINEAMSYKILYIIKGKS